MTSLTLGKSTSEIEITHISKHGIWILDCDEEMFMAFEDFPWFKNSPVEDIFNVIKLSLEHYHWPGIDVDITKEMILNPKKFPLKANFSR